MRKHNIICLSICLVGLLASLAIVYFRYTVPYWQCSEVYKRYHKVEGVEAAYVKNFPINDTLTVAVTLLQAADSAGWEYLLQEFNIPADMVVAAKANPAFDIWVWQILKDHPETRYVSNGDGDGDTVKTEIMSTSFSKQEVCVFHIRNRQEWDAVSNNRLESNCITIDK